MEDSPEDPDLLAIREKHLGTKELEEDQEALSAKEESVKKLQKEIRDVEEDVRAEYEGQASESYIQALISKRTSTIRDMLETEAIEYNTMVTDLNSKISNATEMMNIELQQNQIASQSFWR